MSDTRSIQRVLEAVRRRARGNRLLQAAVDGGSWLLGAWLAMALWNATMPVSLGLGWPLQAAVSLGIAGIFIVRVGAAEPLWRSARRTDRRADLHDELTSAYWFTRHGGASEWIQLHLERASETAGRLDPRRLVPFERPRRLVLPAALAVGLVLIWSLPVPRVFDDLAQRIAELDLTGDDSLDDEPVASLDELGDPADDPELLSPEEEEQDRLVPMDEEPEQAGQDALEEGEEGEEGEPQEGEEPQEGQEPAEQGEPGEQQEGEPAEAQEAQESDSEAEGEPQADPSAGQDDSEGESTEESGPMLPGGEEVFLQEGGEDVEQQPMAEEEMGHATREGGGEEMLQEGEITALDVQLEQEMLEVPEDVAEPEDEDKEELETRQESSYLEFEDVERPSEYAVQELLQAESIPWRYRQLVLDYFTRLRERDNQPPEQEQE